jgi:general stress protein 26
VCWVFSSEGYGDVVTLRGTATIVEEPILLQKIWDRLSEWTRPYVMSVTGDDDAEFVAIETEVHEVELISPRRQIYQPIRADLTNGSA